MTIENGLCISDDHYLLGPNPSIGLSDTTSQAPKVTKEVKEEKKKEKEPPPQDVASLQQEENVSISGSNARLMIMKKLSRKSKVCAVLTISTSKF